MSAEAALDLILAACAAPDPEAACRAKGALDVVLAGVRQSSWPEVAWNNSRLCPGGFPVEFIWRPGRSGTFWSAEVAGPELPERAKLDRAATLLAELGSAPVAPDLLQYLKGLQSGAPLNWGAWLGGRHTQTGDSFKLYAEIPPGRKSDGLALFPAAQDWAQTLPGTSRLRLFGHEPLTRRSELYFRIQAFDAGDFYAPARHMGPAGSALMGELTRIFGRLPDVSLQGQGVGLSISLGQSGEMEAITFIGVARRTFGSEPRLQKRLAEVGFNLDSPLPQLWLEGRLAANVFSVSASLSGATSVHLGLCPRSVRMGNEAVGF